MNKIITRFSLIAFLLIPAMAAADPTVTLNGVDITGLKNQTFENTSITFDAHGNIQIVAPQYKILTADNKESPSAPSPSAAAPTSVPDNNWQTPVNIIDPVGKYADGNEATLPNNIQPTMLLAQFNQPGLLGYNVDIFINGQYVKTFTQSQPQQSLNVTQYLHQGRNEFRYRTTKAADAGASSSATVEISLSKVTAQQGNAFELTGQYGKVLVKSTDGERMYQMNIIVP